MANFFVPGAARAQGVLLISAGILVVQPTQSNPDREAIDPRIINFWDDKVERRKQKSASPALLQIDTELAIVLQKELKEIQLLVRSRSLNHALLRTERAIERFGEDSRIYNMLGTIHLAKGDLGFADSAFQRALELHPESIAVRMNLAKVMSMTGHSDRAVQQLREVLGLSAGHVGASLRLAQLLEDPESALEVLNAAKAVDPSSSDLLLEITKMYLKAGRPDAALAEVRAAMLRPDQFDSTVLRGLGSLLIDGQLIDQGIGIFAGLVEGADNPAQAWYWLGMAQGKARDYEGAAASLNRSLEEQGDFLDALVAKVRLAQQFKRFPEAIDAAISVQERYPGSPDGFVLEGDVHLARGDFQRAVAKYKKGFGKSPRGDIARALARGYVQLGNFSDAQSVLTRLLRFKPGDTQTRFELALVLQRAGLVEQAIGEYNQVLEKFPAHPWVLNNLAWLYAEDDLVKALDFAQRAIKLAPANPDFIDSYGWMLVENEQIEEGINQLKQAIELKPDDLDFKFHLAAAYERAGNTDLALSTLQTVLIRDREFPNKEKAYALYDRLRDGG